MGDGPALAGAVARPSAGADPSEGSPLVLDLVVVAAVVALFALLGAVAAGVDRL